MPANVVLQTAEAFRNGCMPGQATLGAGYLSLSKEANGSGSSVYQWTQYVQKVQNAFTTPEPDSRMTHPLTSEAGRRRGSQNNLPPSVRQGKSCAMRQVTAPFSNKVQTGKTRWSTLSCLQVNGSLRRSHRQVGTKHELVARQLAYAHQQLIDENFACASKSREDAVDTYCFLFVD